MIPMNSGARPQNNPQDRHRPPATPPTMRKPKASARYTGQEAHAEQTLPEHEAFSDGPSDHKADDSQDPADQADPVQETCQQLAPASVASSR